MIETLATAGALGLSAGKTIATSLVGKELVSACSVAAKNVGGLVLNQMLDQSVLNDPALRNLVKLAVRTGVVVTDGSPFWADLEARTNLPLQDHSSRLWDPNAWIDGGELVTKPVVTPADLATRFRELSANLDGYVRFLMTHDPDFAAEISRRVQALVDSEGPGDVDRVLTQIRISTSGKLAERMVIDTLKPFFEGLELQQVKSVGDSFTKVDFLGTQAKQNIVLGRGEGMSVPEGGTLAIEVKTGKPEYIRQQLDHLEFQVKGHADADASLVVTSKDVYNIPGQGEQFLRGEIKVAGSRVMAFLPEKARLDEACDKLVRDAAGA